ncbi:MAG: DNA repair protein RecN, partial [Erysipelotrichaceae bacterium]|nr:DNA repair protein RecN [Erysipelotrichaceae bacterium]
YDIYYNMKDQYEEVLDIYHEYQFDEYRFNELQDILFKVNRLKRKYGFTMEAISEYRQDLAEQIERIEHREEFIDTLKKQINEVYHQALDVAQKISTIRQQKALQFEQDIQHILKDLYLENTLFKVEFSETDLSTQGIDKIRFMVSINKGQNLSLLNESASGGEVSRIMLAIKMVILQYENVETIIFDEVDSGVSGKVATSIGEKMHQLAKYKQVICITHLPQVASLADNHYSIEKTMDETESISSIKQLNNDERIYEIAKMLSGEHVTHEAIENAKKLLNV